MDLSVRYKSMFISPHSSAETQLDYVSYFGPELKSLHILPELAIAFLIKFKITCSLIHWAEIHITHSSRQYFN